MLAVFRRAPGELEVRRNPELCEIRLIFG